MAKKTSNGDSGLEGRDQKSGRDKSVLTPAQKAAASRERRERLAERTEATDRDQPQVEVSVFPQTPVRIYPEPLVAPGSDPNVFRTIMIPLPDAGAGPGRRDLMEIESRLQESCSLFLLRAYDLIRQSGNSTAELAEKRLSPITPLTLDFMRRTGRQKLKALGIPAGAVDELAMVLCPDTELVNAHESIAQWLGRTLLRTQRVLRAAEKASKRKNSNGATHHIHDAYKSPPFTIENAELVRIASASDIDPTSLWPQKVLQTPMIEVARFATQLLLDRSRPSEIQRARLQRSLFTTAEELLSDASDTAFQDPVSVGLVRRLLRAADPEGRLGGAIACTDIAGSDLVIGEGAEPQ